MEEEVEALKSKGNEHFVKKEFQLAVEFYTKALQINNENAILYTNRSAAYLELGQYSLAFEDSERAIQLNPKFTKSYFRKSSAVNKLGGGSKDVFDVWQNAYKNCEHTPELQKYYNEALGTWKKQFKTANIVDSIDLIERYNLLKDKRERLSTMAHL